MEPLKLNKKYNPGVAEDLESSLVAYGDAIQRCDDILSLEGHRGWERLKELLKEQIDPVENRLKNFESYDDNQIRFMLKHRTDFNYFLKMIEETKERKQMLEEEMSKIRISLESRRKIENTAHI